MVGAGATISAAATVWIPFLGQADAGILGIVAGVSWGYSGFLQYRDRGYGDTIKYFGSVPYWAYPNTP